MATLLLRIDGLDEGAGPALERALRELPGVYGVVVSAPQGCAELDVEEDEVSIDAIVARVEREGYTAAPSG